MILHCSGWRIAGKSLAVGTWQCWKTSIFLAMTSYAFSFGGDGYVFSFVTFTNQQDQTARSSQHSTVSCQADKQKKCSYTCAGPKVVLCLSHRWRHVHFRTERTRSGPFGRHLLMNTPYGKRPNRELVVLVVTLNWIVLGLDKQWMITWATRGDSNSKVFSQELSLHGQ